MKLSLFLASISFYLIIGCTPKKNTSSPSLTGAWRLFDVQLTDQKDHDFDASLLTNAKLKEGSLINFTSDQTFVELGGEGNFISGHYPNLNNDEKFSLQVNKQLSLKAKLDQEVGPDGNQMAVLTIQREKFLFKYLKMSDPLRDNSEDPFGVGNNIWRIKPTHKEGTDEINKRLAGYFKHLALILKAAKERKDKVVSFEFSQGPVKIYNGGIGIYDYPEVPESWINIFFDEADAIQAYTLFQKYLLTNHFRGVSTGNWIDDDYSILVSIYADFNKNSTGLSIQ